MLESFENLGLQPSLVQSVEDMGYKQPTPIQLEAIPALLNGRNVLGQAQTGTGKTAAFVLPMLQAIQPGAGHIQALIMTPTRELAIQVTEAVTTMSRKNNVQVLAVYGGQSYEIQIRRLRRGVDVVVGTPGRLLDLIQKELLDLTQVKYLVLDEADEMLEMGFIDDVETIMAQVPAGRQMALFSATLPGPVRRLSERYLSNPHQITVSPTHLTVEDTDQSFCLVREEQKLAVLIRLLEAEEVKIGLIFARTKARTQELADELARRGYPAEALHGDLSQQRREYVLNRFRHHYVSLLVATDVAARGLDIDDVTHVFNYDAPGDAEDYVHRIGRTGRAGRKGVAISLFSPRDRQRQAQIESYTKQRITQRTVPSLEAITARRDEKLMQTLAEQMMQGSSQREHDLVAQLAAGGWDLIDLAAAALKMARAGESALPAEEITEVVSRARAERRSSWNSGEQRAPSREYAGSERKPRNDRPYSNEPQPTSEKPSHLREGRKSSRNEPEMVRLWMNLGDAHGLRPGDVVGAIASEVGIPGKAIGEINIQHDHTFVDISEKHVRDVLRQSSGNYFLRGKPVTLKLAD